MLCQSARMKAVEATFHRPRMPLGLGANREVVEETVDCQALLPCPIEVYRRRHQLRSQESMLRELTLRLQVHWQAQENPVQEGAWDNSNLLLRQLQHRSTRSIHLQEGLHTSRWALRLDTIHQASSQRYITTPITPLEDTHSPTCH